MTLMPRPVDELQRLASLDPALNDLTRLAARVCDAPIAVISIVEEQRVCFLGRRGMPVAEVPRSSSFCAHAIRGPSPFVVPDALQDPRFIDNPLVTGEPFVRFYAGAWLVTPENEVLGVLSIMDRLPRELSSEQRNSLAVLSRQVMTHLELRRSERRLRNLIDGFGPAVLVGMATPDGRIIEVNRSALLATGLTAEQILGKRIDELPLWQHSARVVQDLRDAMDRARRGEASRYDTQLRTPDKQLIDIDFSLEPVRDENGTVSFIVPSASVITGRKQAERRLQQLNRVHSMLSGINETIVRAKDPQAMLEAACRLSVEKGRFLMAWIGLADKESNRMRIAAHAGASKDTLEIMERLICGPHADCSFTFHALNTGQHGVCNDIDSDPQAVGWREAALERGYRAMAALPLRLGDVNIGTFNLYAREPGFFDDEELQLLDQLARDISFALQVQRRERERVQLEEQFRQVQKMEAIGQLAGGVAHDFNNILTVIQGYSSLLLMGAQSDEAVAATEQIAQAAERAAVLTRQLLAFSRRQVMQTRLLDLNTTVSGINTLLQRILGADVSLQVKLAPRQLVTRADSGMLDQVLMNLVVNARDAMPHGGQIVIETGERRLTEKEAREIAGASPGRYVSMRVADTGLGIAPDVLPHIFEPFFTTKEQGRGTGLGLATVFGIVTQHGGAVRVDTAVGHGTTFEVLLPAADAGAGQLDEQVTDSPARGGNETILIAEDDPHVRMLMRVVLERQGYRVLEAAHGWEALRVWDQHGGAIHLLLADMVMPEGMSGRQLATRLQARNPGLRVLFTSGYSAEIAGRELSLDERENFIQKPSPPRELLERVRRCLDSTPRSAALAGEQETPQSGGSTS